MTAVRVSDGVRRQGARLLAAARLTGARSREALAIATLMNARGMVELILVNLGLQRGLITPTMFAMLVLMAIGTTVMTGPVFSLILGREDEPAVRPPAGRRPCAPGVSRNRRALRPAFFGPSEAFTGTSAWKPPVRCRPRYLGTRIAAMRSIWPRSASAAVNSSSRPRATPPPAWPSCSRAARFDAALMPVEQRRRSPRSSGSPIGSGRRAAGSSHHEHIDARLTTTVDRPRRRLRLFRVGLPAPRAYEGTALLKLTFRLHRPGEAALTSRSAVDRGRPAHRGRMGNPAVDTQIGVIPLSHSYGLGKT